MSRIRECCWASELNPIDRVHFRLTTMATETAGYIREPLPPYNASTYPAQRLFLSVKEKIRPAEKRSVEQLFDAIKECDKKNPDDIRNHILEKLKDVDAHDTLKNLTENIHQISSYFEKISVELGKLDEKNYRKKGEGSSEGETIEKFRPAWKQIHAVCFLIRFLSLFSWLLIEDV